MSTVDFLIEQIEALSSEVENYLEKQNEENCPNLLSKRQLLLEELAVIANKASSKEFLKYQDFLRRLQARDYLAKSSILEQQKLLLSQSGKQSRAKKAVKAYNKFGS